MNNCSSLNFRGTQLYSRHSYLYSQTKNAKILVDSFALFVPHFSIFVVFICSTNIQDVIAPEKQQEIKGQN